MAGRYRYEIGSTLYVPRHDSPHTAAELVAMARHHQPLDTEVWAGGRAINIRAAGTYEDADHAMRVAYREILAGNDRQIASYYLGYAVRVGLAWGDPLGRGLFGMIVAMSAALGFVIPPRPRAARCPACERVVRHTRPERTVPTPITRAITGGIAAASVILVIATFFLRCTATAQSTSVCSSEPQPADQCPAEY